MALLVIAVLAYVKKVSRPVDGPFSPEELRQFTALNPIDAHIHVFADNGFLATLKRLNLHVIDILVVDDTNPVRHSLSDESQKAWQLAGQSDGRVLVCTTFDPYQFNQPGFAALSIRQIDQEFDKGAVAVKIWKNIGMEVRDSKGNYILPDDPSLDPIYQDIAAHQKTLIAHIADPDSLWKPLNPDSTQYTRDNPEFYMYTKPNAPAKEQLLRARDHIMERNPSLRVVGAHLGSMENNFEQLARQLDAYPNFAVDLSARFPYLMARPRTEMISFITKYQDRLIYGTDLELGFGEKVTIANPEETYARHWRFLGTKDKLPFRGHTVQGLALPPEVLRKLYHDNAVRWFPGILPAPASRVTGQ